MQLNEVIGSNELRDEMLRLARKKRYWVAVKYEDQECSTYSTRSLFETFLTGSIRTGSEMVGLMAQSHWLLDGPKVFRPTLSQCDALEQIEIGLQLDEYSQPFPSIYVELPKERYGEFRGILCTLLEFEAKPFLACLTISKDFKRDIVTCVSPAMNCIERSIEIYEAALEDQMSTSLPALRVALNSCLALTSFGHHADYLHKKEAERDQQLAAETDTERGERARQRVKLQPQLLTFVRDVVLMRREQRERTANGDGNEKASHWRRGHWRSQPYGPENSLRKPKLIPAVFVRADRLEIDPSDTVTNYSAK